MPTMDWRRCVSASVRKFPSPWLIDSAGPTPIVYIGLCYTMASGKKFGTIISPPLNGFAVVECPPNLEVDLDPCFPVAIVELP